MLLKWLTACHSLLCVVQPLLLHHLLPGPLVPAGQWVGPAQPRFLKTASVLEDNEAAPWGDYQFGWLESSGDYLFAANYEGGIYCIDISDPENPHFVGRARTGMQWKVGYIRGDYLYVPTVEGLWVVDVPTTSQVPKGSLSVR